MRKSGRLFGSLIIAIVLSVSCRSSNTEKVKSTPTIIYDDGVSIWIYDVTVNYNRNIRQMIEAGKYALVAAPIVNHYKNEVYGNGLWGKTVALIYFNKPMTTNEVMQVFDKRRVLPGTLTYLLAFGIDNPVSQREYPLEHPIVALGSSHKNSDDSEISMIPYLYGNGHERFLSEIESTPNLAWRENTGFLFIYP